MRYDEAFDAVLRERYDLLEDEEILAAGRRRQGRLHRGDQDCYAIVDAYRNHRCHTDAFELAMPMLGDFLEPGHAITVVDIGAGAGNVAAAFCETWEPERTGSVTCIGVEPHDMMRRLGIALLRELAPDWMDTRYVERCCDVAAPPADRYLVTLNYVVQQPGIRAADLTEWAALVAALQRRAPTCVLSVSVRSASTELATLDRTTAFVRELDRAGLVFDIEASSLRMDRRMPRRDGRGWVVQPARGDDWPNVQIATYRMTARGEGTSRGTQPPGGLVR